MKTTLKTLSALLLGAALVTPALAQDTAPANNGTPAQTTDANAAPAAAPTTPVDTTTAANAATTPGNTEMAMNTTGNAADLSSVPDTSKKYSRTSRAKDYKSEAQVTRELNQKESGMNGATTAQ